MAATVVRSDTDPLQQRKDAAQTVESASDGGRAAAADGAVAATVVGSATVGWRAAAADGAAEATVEGPSVST